MSLKSSSRFALTAVTAAAFVAIGGFAFAQTTTSTSPPSPPQNSNAPPRYDAPTTPVDATGVRAPVSTTTTSTTAGTATSPALPLGTDGRQPDNGGTLPGSSARPPMAGDPMPMPMPSGDANSSMPADPSRLMSNDPSRMGTTTSPSNDNYNNSSTPALPPKPDRN